MLSDIERKVLRIIANFSVGRRRTPTVDEMCVKTGRSRSDVMEVLAALVWEGYIEYCRILFLIKSFDIFDIINGTRIYFRGEKNNEKIQEARNWYYFN
jgi:hypothetical protein